MKPELSQNEQEKAMELAGSLAKDFDADRSEEFASRHKEKKWYDDFMLLLAMLKDRDFHLKPSTWAILAGALAYVVLPVDIIPDFILGLGWLDDTFVLAMVMAGVEQEISEYRKSKTGQSGEQ